MTLFAATNWGLLTPSRGFIMTEDNGEVVVIDDSTESLARYHYVVMALAIMEMPRGR